MPRKLKVIVNAIPAANPLTGIGRYVVELYEALSALGSELDIHFFDGHNLSKEPPTSPRNLDQFSRLSKLFWSLPPSMALAVRIAHHRRRERRLVHLSQGMDIYHETAFFPFRVAPGVRTVQTVHDLSIQVHPEWHPKERVAYANRYFKPRLSWSSAILTVSEFTRRELLAFEPAVADKVLVSPLGVSSSFYPAAIQERDSLRARYGLEQDYLLFVGSGDPRKNVRTLTEVIDRGKLGCELVCVGWSGWKENAKRGQAKLLGYLPDKELPALYSSALAFVFPSLYEGFGLPVLEAMACGCPVIVPNAHTMSEIVGDAGIFYGQPSDVDGLEKSLVDIVSATELRKHQGESGLRQAAKFTWQRTAERTLAAFLMALGDSAKR